MVDWRLQGQEKYLHGLILVRKKYQKYGKGWDHDHCEFCWTKFSLKKGDMHEGYATKDNYRWICDMCFNDFKEQFEWRVE